MFRITTLSSVLAEHTAVTMLSRATVSTYSGCREAQTASSSSDVVLLPRDGQMQQLDDRCTASQRALSPPAHSGFSTKMARDDDRCSILGDTPRGRRDAAIGASGRDQPGLHSLSPRPQPRTGTESLGGRARHFDFPGTSAAKKERYHAFYRWTSRDFPAGRSPRRNARMMVCSRGHTIMRGTCRCWAGPRWIEEAL